MKNSLWTKLLSMLLALIMMLGTLPVTALPALAAGVPETLVTSLTELYSGDETHAREDLEALYAAGLLDDDGKLVDLDIREDGEPVELDALAERIGNGETVGLISVNGTVVTPEQILKISQVKVAVEIAAMLDEEIDVTDEHVENLESLLNGIQNGEVDLDNAIRTGALRLSKTGASLRGTGTDESTAPVTYNHTDALTLSEDGTSYIAPYISGTTYIPNYHFELPDEAEGSTSFSESVDYVGSPVARMKTGFDTDVVHDVMPADSGVLSKYAISYTLPGSRSLDFPGGPWDFSYVVDWKWFSSFGNTGNMISSGQLSVSSQGLNVNWTPDIYAAGGSAEERWLGERAFVYGLSNNSDNRSSQVANVALNNGQNAQYVRVLFTKEGATEANTGDNATSTAIKSISVLGADKKYYVDEYVPFVVEFDNYVRADKDTELIVNGTKCDLLDGEGVYYNKLLFGYKAAYNSNTTLIVESLDGLKTKSGAAMTLTNHVTDLPHEFSSSVSWQKLIQTNIWTNWFDWEKAYCVTDDNRVTTTVTAVIPLKTDPVVQNTIANLYFNEHRDQNMWKDGIGVNLKLPGFTQAARYRFLPFMYFAYNGPSYENDVYHDYARNRYPVYVVEDENGMLALATRFAAPLNLSDTVRRDTLCLYANNYDNLNKVYDMLAESRGRICPGSDYLATDPLGYPWWDYHPGKHMFYYYYKLDARAPIVPGGALQYFVPPVIKMSDSKYTDRTEEYEVAENGFIKLTNPVDPDFKYVYLKDNDHPERQYDVEIAVTEDLYQACVDGAVYITGNEDYRTSVHISDRKPFTFTDKNAFRWETTNNTVKFTSERNTSTSLLATAVSTAPVSIKVYNYSLGNNTGSQQVLMSELPRFYVKGVKPYLMIPKTSQIRDAFVGNNIDVIFASNAGAFTADENGTVFTAHLYKIDEDQIGKPIAEEAEEILIDDWGEFLVSKDDAVPHITVPGSALTEIGAYAVSIRLNLFDGNFTREYSATAYIRVKHAPARVRFHSHDATLSANGDALELGYTLTSAADSVVVKYTVQGSGEEVSEMRDAFGGKVSFLPDAFTGLKKVYTVTIYARNSEEDPWSVDSMLLTVYNTSALRLLMADVPLGKIGGTTGGQPGEGSEALGKTVNIDNSSKLYERLATDGEGKGFAVNYDDFYTLRSEMGLLRVISANYREGAWGTLTDKLIWSFKEKNGATSNAITLNYEQGGLYSDLRSYSFTYYVPTTNLLVMATANRNEESPVTITAKHAASGMEVSVDVTASTLKDKLYLFRFNPKTTTYVVYTNGEGVERKLHSDARGELAVFEPSGIRGDVITMSESGGDVFVGTINHNKLVGGEQNVTRLQLYPTNDLTLVPLSSYTVTFLQPDGTPYNGEITLRAGVYKGGDYCPEIGIHTTNDKVGDQILREDAVFTAVDGKITIWYDPTQLVSENGWNRGLRYVYEYRADDRFVPAYTILNPASSNPADSIIYLQASRDKSGAPQITNQTYQQYLNGTTPTAYTRNVIDSVENIGISPNFSMAKLYTDVVLLGEPVGKDASGYTTYSGENIVKFALRTVGGEKLKGQSELDGAGLSATQIKKLSDLDTAALYVFPFSSVPMVRSTYTMTDADLKANGITDEGDAPTPTARIKAVFTRGDMTIKTVTMPFGVTNVVHQPDLTDSRNGATVVGKEVRDNLRETTDIGAIFRSINVNDMIRKGFVFLGNLAGAGGDNPINLMILPTQDPATFRIIAFVGANQRPSDDEDDCLSVNFNPNDLAEDMASLQKKFEEAAKDDDDDDDGGDASMQFNFYGTIILEVRAGVADGKWNIAFRGGNVGANVKGKYEWDQTFFCGPYPAFISFEVGFHADLEVAFGNKNAARAMLLDAALGVSIEAFAGLGFDLSIVALQLGIYGAIGADVNFLLLTPSDSSAKTGTKLTISGEIGIKLKIKLLFISYTNKIASTGFNWTKKWNNYDQIKQYWSDTGFGQLFGMTRSGRAYTMFLFNDGSTMVEIEGGAELENRDYLDLAERSWTSGQRGGAKRLMKAAAPITDVQTNAYPYSHPAFTDDGQLFLYISDNDNAKAVESVASYALKSGDGYENKERVDTAEENILADLDVVASGTKDAAFAAWVKQVESPKVSDSKNVTNEELGMMFNATEIYAGTYDGTAWTTERLTDNNVADMAPAVASAGNKAIVAWRSMSASSMTTDGKDLQDITSIFNVENNINYRIYDGTQWQTAQVAYNGNVGTVNAIDAAMLSDGTAILVYTVRTGEDVTSTETFYTVVKPDGSILTTGRLTSDDYTDTNAQATAVNEDGGYFILGWYSEHDAGEGTTVDYDDDGNGTQKAAVAHDIRLARINKSGSYDIDFPESIGGTGETGITSDFHFSAPAGNTSPENVSIVWSQRKNSNAAEDAGKYELNAVRFFKADNVIGITAQTDIAETAKNYTIDRFDTYTDGDGAIHAIILGSDYSNIENIDVYDTIDLDKATENTVTDNVDSPKNLEILDGEAISSLKLATGTFPEMAADVAVDTNISEVIPGFTAPVQFAVTNTGTSVINEVTTSVGGQNRTFSGLHLLPNQSTTLLTTYDLAEGAVSNAAYSVTGGGVTLAEGTLELNRPDVGISGMKLLRESDGTRDIQVVLTNGAGIPLAGSGKTVKLAFYKDPLLENEVGKQMSISDAASLAEIDAGKYSAVQTIDVTELYDGDGEIPEAGLTVYAKAWVEDTVEPYALNNTSFLSFSGLLTRNNGVKLIEDTALRANEDGSYTVYTDFCNNSMRQMDAGVPVILLLDGDGEPLAQKELQNTPLLLGKEARQSDLTVTFTADELGGAVPAQVEVRHIFRVTFDTNGGSGAFEAQNTDLDAHLSLPEVDPVPPESDPPLFFRGWFTEPDGGEQITEDYTFTESLTLYAQYTRHTHDFAFKADGDTIIATCENFIDDCTLADRSAKLTIVPPQRASGYGMPNATIKGETALLGTPSIRYYTVTENKARGTVLSEAPTAPGTYWAEFTVGTGTGSATAHVVYEIPTIEAPAPKYATIQSFVKVTDPAQLDTMTPTGGLGAYAWVLLNRNVFRTQDMWGIDIRNYVVYNKTYIQRPIGFPEDEPFPYDPDKEYAISYMCTTEDMSPQEITVDELKTLLCGDADAVDAYIPGTESTQVLADADFIGITSIDELSSVPSCTVFEAVMWAIANLDEYPRGVLILGKEENDYGESIYRYLQYTPQRAMIESIPEEWFSDFTSGMPMFIANPNKVINPDATYTVTYDANGGTGTTEEEFYVLSRIELADGTSLSRTGYRFVGWNTEPDGSGTAYAPGGSFDVTKPATFYAQWEHVHNWNYSFDEESSTFTATCTNPGCTFGAMSLRPEAVDKTYDGENATPYVRSAKWTADNGLAFPALTYYSDGQQVSEAKNVGTYTAILSMDGHDVNVSEFNITKKPIIIIADDQTKYLDDDDPTFTASYKNPLYFEFENDETYSWTFENADGRNYVVSGNKGQGNTTSTLTLKVNLTEAGTLSFDYKYGTEGRWDWARFNVDGSEKFSVSDVGDWRTYACDLSAGSHTITWSYSKDGGGDSNGDFFAVDNVAIKTSGSASQESGEVKPDDTMPFDALIADLRFKNDDNHPWVEDTDGDRVYAKAGNSGVDDSTSYLKLSITLTEATTLSFDYNFGTETGCDKCYFKVNGEQKFEYYGQGAWTTYTCDLSAGTYTLEWSYRKDGSSEDYGDFFAIDNIAFATTGEVLQIDPRIALNAALNAAKDGIVEGETLNYTAERTPGEAVGTYTITLIPGENPNYDVKEVRTGTLTILDGKKQTIAAEDLTATYGDTDKVVHGEVTDPETDGGAISYAVKAGSEDYIDVDASTGALTVKKVPAGGKAYVTVRAEKTGIYVATTKTVTVNISKAAITPTLTISGWNYGAAASTPVLAGNTGNGAVTYAYKVKDAADSTYTGAVPTAGGTYTLRAQIAETENYLGAEVTAEFTITVKPVQTVTASDVTATYGDTGVKISASVTEGDGKLGYAVKRGDAVTVDAAGNLTIVKAGTAVVTVTASETETYAKTDKDVTVTVGKATPAYTVPENIAATYGQTLGDIALPEGWAFANSAQSVGNAGTHTFPAIYTPLDTDNYLTVSDVSISVQVGKADPVAVAPTALVANYGDTLSTVALANPSGNTPGTWSWLDGSASVGNAGQKSFNATFTPDDTANYNTLTDIALQLTVNKVAYTGEMTASVNLPAFSGRTATVTLPQLPEGAGYGTITSANSGFFTVGAVENGAVVITASKDFDEATESAARTFTIAVSGATNYNDYTVTVTVTPEFKAVQRINADDVTATYGDTGVKISASVTEGDGQLGYAVTSGDAVTVDNAGNLTIIKAGSAVVTVTASETETYAETTKDVAVTVDKKNVTVTANSASKAYDGKALTDAGFTNTDELVGDDRIESVTVTGSQLYVGSSQNVASAARIVNGETDVTDNYNVRYLPGTLTVTSRTDEGADKKFEITVEANSDSSVKYDGAEHGVSGFKTLAFDFGGVNYTVSGLAASVKGTDAGDYTATVTGTAVVRDGDHVDVTNQFIINTVPGTLTIGRRSLTLTSATQSREYNGNALTNGEVTVTGDGWATGEGATYTVTGSQKVVGSSANSFSYLLNNGTKADNYTITKTEGTLTVTNRAAKYEISPKANSGTVKYDGTAKTVSGFETNSFTVEGNLYTVSGLIAAGAGTDAGQYTVSVSGTAVVRDSDGNDVTGQFSVTPQNGALTVTARDITLTSASASKQYDGSALTNGTVTVGGDGFAAGEGAIYTVTGTRTLVGTAENTFTYALRDNTKATNYSVSVQNGTLTVTNRDTKYAVTLVANSGTYKYDGAEKTVSGWTIAGAFGGGFTAENGLAYTVEGMSSTLTGTDAGTYTVNVTGTPVVKDADGNVVTSEFAVSVESGTLTINKRSVTLTSASDSKAYDGTALTNSNVTVSGDGFAAGEGADYTVTGSRKLPGDSANAFGYTLNGGAKAKNYEIEKVEGTLTITNRTDKYAITVKANSGTFTYDGKEHTVSGFENLNFTFNGVTYTVSGLTATFTGKNAGTYKVAVAGTPVVKDKDGNVLTEQFNVTTVDGTLTIDKLEIKGTLVRLDAFAYGTAVPTAEFINDGNIAGANGTIVEGDSTKNVTYYYQSTAFLKSQTDDIETLADDDGVFTNLAPTTFAPGKHYVLAVISGDNYTGAYITQSVFEVTQNTDAVRTAPKAPAVDGNKITVAEADRAKDLEYSLDGKTWLPAERNENGEFTAEWATPVTDAALQLREAADERYAKPSASAAGNATVTTTTFTVTYDANGGANAPDAVTATADRTVTVSDKAGMTRKGYTFTGWNTKADGSGDAVKAGDKLGTGVTLYAQWTVNTYKVYFNANGGTGTMEDLEFTYDAAKALTPSAFSREGYVFLGWSKTAGGSVLYQDAQSVKNLAENGTVILYAVFAKDLYNIKGSVLSAQTGDITLELVQGNNLFGEQQTVTYTAANEETEFALNGVPEGIYNLVAKQGDVIMTVAVTISGDHVELGTVTMPDGNTSSVIDVKGEDAPAIVVGGLDEVAAAEEVDGRKVTVTITVETQNEAQTGEAGEAIFEESRAQNAEFFDFTVTKTITSNDSIESVETMTEIKSPVEFIIPFDFSRKSAVKVYRYHDGVAEALTEADTGEEGTYRLDRTSGLIYVYVAKFSTYAVVYSNSRSGGSGGGSMTPTYTVSFDTNGGSAVESVSVARGQTIGTIAAPTKTGFAFTGWYTDKELTRLYPADEKVTASTTLYAGWTPQIILTIDQKEATVGGEVVVNDVAPIIRSDRTMLPIRFVAENLGATVEWIADERKAVITRGGAVIEIFIDSDQALVNGVAVQLDSPAFIENNRTYLPVRFVAENLGATVEWNAEARQAIITPAQ